MVAVAGLRGTGDWGTDERPKNFRETILFLNPNGEAPLTALMSRMGSESVDDPEFNWWEEEQGHVRVQLNDGTGMASGDTAMVVDSGALSLVTGDMLLVETDETGIGEIVVVTADPTTDTALTVARGAAGTTAATIADNTFLTKIGNAFEEGSNAPKATSRNPTKLNNFCQIWKTPYNVTETAKRTRARTGELLKNERKRKMFDHSRDLEMSMIFGKPFEDTTGNEPKRFTGGLNHFITTNRTNYTGTGQLTEDSLIDAISPVFNFNGEGAGDQRLAFCGNEALTAINKLARNSASTRVNFEGVIKQWGMNLHQFTLPQGRIFLRTHPLFNVHATYSGLFMVVNPRGLKWRHMRDTRFKDNIQENDADRDSGMWLTEGGLEVHHERTMAVLTGVKSANL